MRSRDCERSILRYDVGLDVNGHKSASRDWSLGFFEL